MNRTGTNKKCPKCGQHTMVRNNRTPGGKQRWICKRVVNKEFILCYTTTNPDAPYRNRRGTTARQEDKNPQFRRSLKGVKRFVVTSAQNATPIHEGFFKCLQTYCDYNKAELIVVPLRYKNPTSRWTESQENMEKWDDALKPYLYNQRKKMNENLMLMADAKTQPTATKPLSSFESITGASSGIFGHTKIQMQCIPTPQGRYPKMLLTTGAVTIKNYTDSKAGKKGEFHHALAAVVVEVIGKKFFVRHVNFDEKDQSFIDLDNKYGTTYVSPAGPALALVFGDTHRQFIDKTVERVTFGSGGMVERLDPKHLIFHDLHDGYARNPHHRLDPFTEIAKRNAGLHKVEKEVREDVEWLVRVCGERQGIVVPSNHDNFFARWIMDTDWRRDPDNASFYLETAKVMVDSAHMTENGSSRVDPFIYWVNRLKGDAPIRCLGRDESFALGGVELSMHGDLGPNGTRGSRENLRRIGVKTIIGHSHTPGIEEGCYQAGTSTPLRLEYNAGPSSWLQAHVVLYANGKRAILPIIDGLWCFDASTKV